MAWSTLESQRVVTGYQQGKSNSAQKFRDFVTELDFSVEIYSPEKHDMNLN